MKVKYFGWCFLLYIIYSQNTDSNQSEQIYMAQKIAIQCNSSSSNRSMTQLNFHNYFTVLRGKGKIQSFHLNKFSISCLISICTSMSVNISGSNTNFLHIAYAKKSMKSLLFKSIGLLVKRFNLANMYISSAQLASNKTIYKLWQIVN